MSGANSIEELPDNARRYCDAIERLVGVQISFLSVGPGRDETITLVDPFLSSS
ncbi:MAG: adenylosuccinate synthetase [Myxococcota bacterium]|nr:adenylosuccinate synthetase [Myxococcota bacterium]